MFIKNWLKSYFIDGLPWALPWGFPIRTIHSTGSRGRGLSRGRFSIGLTDNEAAEAGLHMNPVNGRIEK
jgi:hypothetical protein